MEGKNHQQRSYPFMRAEDFSEKMDKDILQLGTQKQPKVTKHKSLCPTNTFIPVSSTVKEIPSTFRAVGIAMHSLITVEELVHSWSSFYRTSAVFSVKTKCSLGSTERPTDYWDDLKK